ncbi:uncharacterized protein LOC129761610 isoform X2 [Toxorhynchites rutilus septentrionalis]|uniref:uncharacterized protein LOC129761610 isoform X2 n=1 Tax=Toxorhynchites rutilus septentrionalis TaxID=329112 RepID=UPI0024799B65|nr:uncharacterized protein LOC129761610 isoform X2 [Toxorhynchites rutilus septentrionalis]
MNVQNKTCLFCLKQRQILVDDPSTAKAIQKTYRIKLASDSCRVCIECHFNIKQIGEFKSTIGNAGDISVGNCFACKSENTVNTPGVDRVVDYLLKQCKTIDLGKTETARACASCLYLLEICIKYEKMARNYSNAQRFCKQFATIRECNVALWKLDLDKIGNICESIPGGGKGAKVSGGGGQNVSKDKNTRKRGRGSLGEREDAPAKRLRHEDTAVLPVMLTKLTPTVTPTRTEKKKSFSPNSTPGSSKANKQSEKIFIKLPMPKKLYWKKRNQQRKRYGPPHSPSRSIPSSPSTEDLNRIFKVELRPLVVRIERVDLSSYLNRTTAHDTDTRQLRKPQEEFIGLDEEDVVELQQSNTSICSSAGKRKSILITERIESPYSAKKKVKFSDSPSIKYVDKLSFSEDESGGREGSDDEKDADHNDKKKSAKTANGSPITPPNAKSRKTKNSKKDEAEEQSVTEENTAEKVPAETGKDATRSKDDNPSNDDDTTHDTTRVEETDSNKDYEGTQAETCASEVEDRVANVETENGEISEKNSTAVESTSTPESENEKELPPEESTAPMETDESETSANPEAIAEKSDEPADAEMHDATRSDSPEDVDMVESKSPPAEDVEMQEVTNVHFNGEEHHSVQESSDDKLREKNDSPNEVSSADFEAYDKNEEEIEQVQLSLSDFLGQEISDSEQGVNELETQNSAENTSDIPTEKRHPDSEIKAETQLANELSSVCQSKADVMLSEPESSEKVKNQSFCSLDDVDDISDDDDILDQLDRANGGTKDSPDLPPLGEDSLQNV